MSALTPLDCAPRSRECSAPFTRLPDAPIPLDGATDGSHYSPLILPDTFKLLRLNSLQFLYTSYTSSISYALSYYSRFIRNLRRAFESLRSLRLSM